MAATLQVLLSLSSTAAENGIDDFQTESNGTVTTITGGQGFAANGVVYQLSTVDFSLDDLSSESNGSISSVTGGTNFGGNGSFA